MGTEYYSTTEVAKKVGLTYLTVIKHIKLGKLKAFKVGGVYRISDEDLNNYIRGGE